MNQTLKMISRRLRWPFIFVTNLSGLALLISYYWFEPTIFGLIWLAGLLTASILRAIGDN